VSRAVLSLGANVGDRLAALQLAVDTLAGQATVVDVSPVYETEPVGGVVQDDFLNAVVRVDTDLSPREVVLLGQAVENAAGRVRAERWGPRSLDVDLVTYDDVVSDDPVATVPHPRAHERSFVLRPWLDLDADAVLPGRGPVVALLANATGEVRRTALALRVPA
jgi:2-amino-4-hydroxy-6-hydroxymethyldihydropteridine diphosphokinase